MDRHREGYVLTTEPARIDIDRVHARLSQESYWAKGRERAVVERSVAGSLPYSVYAQEEQAAFARVVTDGATFAWICDVFVDEQHRGRGLGTWLVESIVEDLAVGGVQRFVMATRDAHEVYRRCGFAAMEGADRWMESIGGLPVPPCWHLIHSDRWRRWTVAVGRRRHRRQGPNDVRGRE